MPAILPSLLKKQIENLFQHFDSPKTFIIVLKELFDFYADRTRRLGQRSKKPPRIRAYNLPKQVSRQIEIKFEKYVKSGIETGFEIADLLWQESWLECRVFAFLILGWLSPDDPDRIKARLAEWCRYCGMDPVQDASLARGVVLLWKGSPELTINSLESWLTSSELNTRKWGLRVIHTLVQEPKFDNLPVIFRYLSPFIQKVSSAPDTDLIIAVQNLARQAPQETAYFLQRNFTSSENPGIYTLMRQSLDFFDTQTRGEIKDFLHQTREQASE